MKKKLEKFKITELSQDELANINGGGSAFEWLGRIAGRFNQWCTEACKNGYEHAGLFY